MVGSGAEKLGHGALMFKPRHRQVPSRRRLTLPARAKPATRRAATISSRRKKLKSPNSTLQRRQQGTRTVHQYVAQQMSICQGSRGSAQRTKGQQASGRSLQYDCSR